MITTELFFGLITYYFIMFMTPGPNNAMLAISGIKFGFSKTGPHMTGITIGHVLQVILVAFELGQTSPAFRSLIGTNNGIGSSAILIDGTEEQKQKRYLVKWVIRADMILQTN